MALKDAVSTVINRNAFYRDGYRMLLRISLVQTIAIIVLAAGIVSLFMTAETRQVYFATTSDGRIINIVPLNEPYRSPAEVITWAAAAARNVMQFNYLDYRARLQEASSNFTDGGWQSFSKALKEAGIMEAVTARKLLVSLTVGAAPEIKNAGVNNGVYTWLLQFPVVITFSGPDAPAAIRTALLLQVVRVSTLQNPDGISIAQWVAVRPGKGQ